MKNKVNQKKWWKGEELFIEKGGIVYEATLMIGNEANQQAPRVTLHINQELPMPFNDMGSNKTY